MKLAPQQPAHLERLIEIGASPRIGMPLQPLRQFPAIRVDGLALAQIREKNAPRPAVSQKRVVTNPPDRDNDIGISDQSVQVDPPAFLRGGEIGKLGAIP